jgi:hypothetical protein
MVKPQQQILATEAEVHLVHHHLVHRQVAMVVLVTV